MTHKHINVQPRHSLPPLHKNIERILLDIYYVIIKISMLDGEVAKRLPQQACGPEFDSLCM